MTSNCRDLSLFLSNFLLKEKKKGWVFLACYGFGTLIHLSGVLSLSDLSFTRFSGIGYIVMYEVTS